MNTPPDSGQIGGDLDNSGFTSGPDSGQLGGNIDDGGFAPGRPGQT